MVLLVSIQIKAQNATVDFNKVRTNFLEAKQIGFDVEVYQYESESTKGKLLSKGVMRKVGGNYYSSFLGNEMIINEKNGTVIIDEPTKEITYLNPEKNTKKSDQLTIPDSLLSAFKFEKVTSDGLKKYVYVNTKPLAPIVKTELYINQKYQLVKLVYFYNKSNTKVDFEAYKVEILYKNIITSGIANTYFNTNKYISLKNNKPQLNKQYLNYTLLN